MNRNFMTQYNLWVEKCEKSLLKDEDIIDELYDMNGDEARIKDAFYRNLAFGTGGLRGIIGAGTNRINVYTVAKASQGLADYVNKRFPTDMRKIAISFDSRIKSDLFSRVAAEVFAANGISVLIYSELMPTPCLSYAVRTLHCAAGVMITASHNPSMYNGYKVYGADGCQITTKAAEDILFEIEKLNIFEDIKIVSYDIGIEKKIISYIPDYVYTSFIEDVKKQSVLFGDEINRDFSIVYSPLNGTGLKPVLRALNESGYTNIAVVPEQEKPDGTFSTCPYPNPEIREAMSLGIEYAKKCNADLLLATDPDCDRVGIAVKDDNGGYTLLSGNQVGILLLEYICSQRQRHSNMPEKPIFIKTIVTTDMAERIANTYGVKTVNVLTGFKFIGEQIGLLEDEENEDSYIFGFEESYGYLSGTYVRDKDAVNGALLICEMFAFYKTRGISILDKLKKLYKEYGFCLNTLHTYEFAGASGFEKMQNIMKNLRKEIDKIGSKCVKNILDYSNGLDGLPKSDVLKFILDDNCSIVVRPSGTEPKLKIYIYVSADSEYMAMKIENELIADIKKQLE